MWKPGSARSPKNSRLTILWFVVSVWLGAACTATEATTAAPTQTLIPAAITDTPMPPPPTLTPPVLPGPQDIVPAQESVLVPAAAQPLVSRVVDDLATNLEVAPVEIKLVLVEAMTWANTDLGCTAASLSDLEQAIHGYRLVLLVGDTVYEYHTDSGTTIRQCGQEGTNIGDTSLLIEIDPVAAELVTLAQRRMAQELDVPPGRVRVVEVTPYTWQDSSLGCPVEGEDYSSVQIDGYRIVLAAGDDEYVFHTDFDRLMPCDEDSEVLPSAAEN
jgi:hypothetical protein